MAKYLVTDAPGGEIEFETRDDTARILQNVKNLMMLRMGELPYDRMRGIDPAIYDLGLVEANEKILPELDRVMGWEPRATVMSAQVTKDLNGETRISAEVEI